MGRFEIALSSPLTFNEGVFVQIEGNINYGQDFGFETGSFPGVIFKVSRIISNEKICLEAPGYGERGNYGNGAIYVSKLWWPKLIKVSHELLC